MWMPAALSKRNKFIHPQHCLLVELDFINLKIYLCCESLQRRKWIKIFSDYIFGNPKFYTLEQAEFLEKLISTQTTSKRTNMSRVSSCLWFYSLLLPYYVFPLRVTGTNKITILLPPKQILRIPPLYW